MKLLALTILMLSTLGCYSAQPVRIRWHAENQLRKAAKADLERWSEAALGAVKFVEVKYPAHAQIFITTWPAEHLEPYIGWEALGTILIACPLRNDYSLETVLLHELGHALGLKHSTAPGSIMATFLWPYQSPVLSNDDKQQIQKLYPKHLL